MSIESMIERSPDWQHDTDAPHTGTVILSLCNLGRNLHDVPFPARCSSDDLVAVEDRIREALRQSDLLSTGEYFSLASLRPSEVQLLAERELITAGMTRARAGQGIFISEDQCLSVLVNDEDHCCIRVISAGLGPQEAWARASIVDDTLNELLDFTFSSEFGFLTRDLNNLGTGLRLSLLMHLPTAAQEGMTHELHALAEARELDFSGVGTGMPDARPANAQEQSERWTINSQALYTSMGGFVSRALHETEGDLFQLRNRTTLGHSESELIFRLKQCAGEIISKELGFRERLREESVDVLEDRVDRARALAANARLIPFDESFTLLSSLRLGVMLGLISDRTVADLNGTLIHCQGAHIERQLQPGVDTVDDLNLKRLRARQFKKLFASAQG